MVTIQVCIGSACHLKGSYNVITKLQNVIKARNLEEQVAVKAAFCLGECTKAVSVKVDDSKIHSLAEDSVEEFFDAEIVWRLTL